MSSNPDASFSFKSYCWSLGTTSFRMKDFHRNVEYQLQLLHEFWRSHPGEVWNPAVQAKYYEFIAARGFVTGEIAGDEAKKAKTARQKTSGLAAIGLIDGGRRLTAAGEKLLQISLDGDFSSDNPFQIPRDSFVYFKQLLKTSAIVSGHTVRPYLVVGEAVSRCGGYLTREEFTYLLPLCLNRAKTDSIVEKIPQLRSGATSLDDIVKEAVLNDFDYPAARAFFHASPKTVENIMAVGINRDGRSHDAPYADLYAQLERVFLKNEDAAIADLYAATQKISGKAGTQWRALLFGTKRRNWTRADLLPGPFSAAASQYAFDDAFFDHLHLFKIKATLSDYEDLNRRYLWITDTFLFADGKTAFTPLFDLYFKTRAKNVFALAYSDCDILTADAPLEAICEDLAFDEKSIIFAFESTQNRKTQSLAEIYDYYENDRYIRFRKLIDEKFPAAEIFSMLDKFKSRQDDAALIEAAGGEADVPTIFEYIVGIAWYRLSGCRGRILDYLKLSLTPELLPRTHAGGGVSDIVYEYEASADYPRHTALIECTLMTGTTQRHGEMEPVSRHLSNHIIDADPAAYAAFVTTALHPSVVSDFRMRKGAPFYRSETEHVEDMMIIPLDADDLKNLIQNDWDYAAIYKTFHNAHGDVSYRNPLEWRKKLISEAFARRTDKNHPD